MQRLKNLAPLTLIVLMSLFMIFPTVIHPTHFFYVGNVAEPPGTDTFANLWRMWWVRHALETGSNPFFTDHLFHPYGMSFYLNLAILLSDFVVAPFVHLAPLIGINNFLYFLSFVLSGWGMFFLCRRVTGDETSSLIAAAIFAFTPFHVAHNTHLTTFSYQWAPFFMLYILKLHNESNDARNGAIAGLFFAIACYSDLNLGTFLLVLSAVYLAFCLLRERGRVLQRAFARKFAWLTFFSCVFVGPYAFLIMKAYLPQQSHEGVRALLEYNVSQSLDLMSFFVPTFMHPVFGSWTEPFYRKAATFDGRVVSGYVELVGYLGYSVIALAIIGFLATKKTFHRFWSVVAALFLILSLGPALKLAGLVRIPVNTTYFLELIQKWEPNLDPLAIQILSKNIGIPLPYLLVHFTPILKANEAPARFFIIGILGLSIVAAFGFRHLSQKHKNIRPAVLATPILLIILFEYYSVPKSLAHVPVPSFYTEVLAKDKNEYAVIDLPLFVNLPNSHPRHKIRKQDPLYSMETVLAMYYQTFHEKKILVGSPDRRPTSLWRYIRENSFLRILTGLSEGENISKEELKTAVEDLVAHKIKYLVIHRRRLTPEGVSAFQETIESTLSHSPCHDNSETVVYCLY